LLCQIDLLKNHHKNNHHINNSHKWTALENFLPKKPELPLTATWHHDQRERRIPRNLKGQNGDVSTAQTL
jgi:hypothetical protein